MQIEVIEDDKNKLRISVKGESHTLTQLVAAAASDKADVASIQRHPTESPIIVVHGKNPKKVLEDAAADIVAKCEDLKKEFSRAQEK